jgi:hypothetical protein
MPQFRSRTPNTGATRRQRQPGKLSLPSNGQMCHSIEVRNPRRDTGFGTLVPAFFFAFFAGEAKATD